MSTYKNSSISQKANRPASGVIAQRLHRDPNKAMQQVMESVERLHTIYEAETDALKKADTNRFLALQEDKMQSAMHYESGINEIVSRKDEMKNVDPQIKKKLNNMQKEFSALSHRNMKALQRMQRTMERLGGTIRSAAKDAARKQRVFSYGQDGQIADDRNKHISISLQEDA